MAVLILACANVSARDSVETTVELARKEHENRRYAVSAQIIENFLTQNHAATGDDSVKYIDLWTLQGANFNSLGLNTKAIELLENSLKLAREIKDEKREASISNALFKIYYISGNSALAEDLIFKALNIYRKLNLKSEEVKVLNNIGLLYYQKGDYTNSIKTYDDALNLAKGDTSTQTPIYVNLAEVYFIQDDLDKAEFYLDKAIELVRQSGVDSAGLQAYLNKALLLAITGRKKEAMTMVAVIEKNLDHRDPERRLDTYSQLSEIKFLTGDSLAALRDVLAMESLGDSLRKMESEEQLRQLLTFYNSERLKEHNNTLRQSVRIRSNIIGGIILLIVLLTAFAVYLIYKMKSDRKKNLLIRAQKEKIQELQRLEHERKEKELKSELDSKNRQLVAFSLDASSVSEFHKKLYDSLSALKGSLSPDVLTEVNQVLSLLKNFNKALVSEDFRVYFNDVHPEFTKKLSELYPDLTPTELRLCSYLYLGMSTKEIASITFREIRSVESSRLRLRKKLNISGEITLNKFLHSIYD